jgi:hypothetical protein
MADEIQLRAFLPNSTTIDQLFVDGTKVSDLRSTEMEFSNEQPQKKKCKFSLRGYSPEAPKLKLMQFFPQTTLLDIAQAYPLFPHSTEYSLVKIVVDTVEWPPETRFMSIPKPYIATIELHFGKVTA